MDIANFQVVATDWAVNCLGGDTVKDETERNYRFIEEAIELVQSLNCTKEDVLRIVDHVYSRPLGEPKQEVGGVMVTLAVLCSTNEISLKEASRVELLRIDKLSDMIRENHNKKLIRSMGKS